MNTPVDGFPEGPPFVRDPDHAPGGAPYDLIGLAFRHKWLLAAGLAAGLALGEAAYLKLGPEYEAASQVLVSRKVALPLSQGGAQTWGDRSEHIALIVSPMIVGRAVERGRLGELPSLRASSDPVDDVVGDLRVKRSAGQDRSLLNVLDVSFRGPSAADARAVVQAVIDAYGEYLEETRESSSSELLRVAQQAHDEVLAKLKRKEQEYHEFREEAPLQWKGPIGAPGVSSTNVHAERVAAIEVERRANLLSRAEIKSRIDVLDAALAAGEPRAALEIQVRRQMAQEAGPGALDETAAGAAAFEAQILPLLLEEQQLLRDFGPDHPDVQAVRSSIDSLVAYHRRQGLSLPADFLGYARDDARDDLVGVYLQSLKQQLAELETRDRELSSLYERESATAKEFSRYQAQDQAHSAELARLRDLWETLLGRMNQIGLQKDNSGYTLKQISPVQETLVLKRMLKFVGAGGLFGLGLAAGLCYLRDLRDTALKSLGEIGGLVSAPLLGGVPAFPKTRKPLRGVHPDLRFLSAPQSVDAENYRAVRTALEASLAGIERPLLMATSPEPADGKSTLAANLAAALAHAGRRVLLIDGDLRRPRIHTLFGIPREIGLTDVIAEEIEFINAVRETTVPRLTLLPAGTVAEAPAELLTSPRLAELFEEARRTFDLVLIDSPPLLSVADPCIAGRLVDGLLLAVRIGKSSRHAVRRAGELAAAHGLRVIGVVANDRPLIADDGYGYAQAYSAQDGPAYAGPQLAAAGSPATLP